MNRIVRAPFAVSVIRNLFFLCGISASAYNELVTYDYSAEDLVQFLPVISTEFLLFLPVVMCNKCCSEVSGTKVSCYKVDTHVMSPLRCLFLRSHRKI